MPQQRKLDGRAILQFMFTAETRVLRVGQKSFAMHVQVEAFSKDHAYQRVKEKWPHLKWEFVCDLDDSHDIGLLGEKLPLNPLVMPSPRLIQ